MKREKYLQNDLEQLYYNCECVLIDIIGVSGKAEIEEPFEVFYAGLGFAGDDTLLHGYVRYIYLEEGRPAIYVGDDPEDADTTRVECREMEIQGLIEIIRVLDK